MNGGDINDPISSRLREHIREEGLELPRHLLRRVRWRSWSFIALPYALITATVVLTRWPLLPLGVLVPIQAVLLLAAHRCFQTLIHDLSHGLLSAKRSVNDYWGNLLVAGWTGGRVQAYRTIHFRHHQYNGSVDDPEHIDMEKVRQVGGLGLFILRYALGLEGWRLVRKYYGPQGGGRADHSHALQDKLPILVAQAALFSIFTFAAGAVYLYVLWIYLAVSWSPLLSRLRFLVEHPGESDHTVSTISWLLERLYFAPYHFNFHFEHHVWPSVPPYRLPELHRHLSEVGYFDRHPDCLNSTFLGSLWKQSKT